MTQTPEIKTPPEFWEWKRSAAVLYLSRGWLFAPDESWQEIRDLRIVRREGHQLDERRFANLFPEVIEHLFRVPNYSENQRATLNDTTLESINHLIGQGAAPDWWGAPPMRGRDFVLPSIDDFPTPEPLCYPPGETHKHVYTSLVRMMGEINMATRRLRGLRMGAWVISPRTSHRWAVWRLGEIAPIRPEFYLPEELRIPACRHQPITEFVS